MEGQDFPKSAPFSDAIRTEAFTLRKPLFTSILLKTANRRTLLHQAFVRCAQRSFTVHVKNYHPKNCNVDGCFDDGAVRSGKELIAQVSVHRLSNPRLEDPRHDIHRQRVHSHHHQWKRPSSDPCNIDDEHEEGESYQCPASTEDCPRRSPYFLDDRSKRPGRFSRIWPDRAIYGKTKRQTEESGNQKTQKLHPERP